MTRINTHLKLAFVAAMFSVLLSTCASLEKAERFHETGSFEREIAVLDALIARAGPKDRPPLLLGRGKAFIASAQKLIMERSPNPAFGGLFHRPTDRERYLWLYTQARKDFESILSGSADVKESSEAQFMVGLINDWPHLNNFLDAIEAYGRTVENYPGTQAARKASERKELIEKIYEGTKNSPHGKY